MKKQPRRAYPASPRWPARGPLNRATPNRARANGPTEVVGDETISAVAPVVALAINDGLLLGIIAEWEGQWRGYDPRCAAGQSR
jgi:hypothetical protein